MNKEIVADPNLVKVNDFLGSKVAKYRRVAGKSSPPNPYL